MSLTLAIHNQPGMIVTKDEDGQVFIIIDGRVVAQNLRLSENQNGDGSVFISGWTGGSNGTTKYIFDLPYNWDTKSWNLHVLEVPAEQEFTPSVMCFIKGDQPTSSPTIITF